MLRLTLLLAMLLLPAAPAAAEDASLRQPLRHQIAGDEGFHGEVARTSDAPQVAERDGPRESGPRGLGSRSTGGRSGAASVVDGLPGAIHPAFVHPTPAPAERLPYHPNAPPVLS